MQKLEYFPFILDEQAVSISMASKKGLALWIVNETGAGLREYYLYDAEGLLNYVKQKIYEAKELNMKGQNIVMYVTTFVNELLNFAYGLIQVDPGKSDQWGAAEIKATAAQKGYGPMLYDIVMSTEGALVPDRRSVSTQAQGVWAKYKSSRNDVVAKYLDDASDPKTLPKKDDSRKIYPGGPENPLNYAYFATKQTNAGPLKMKHYQFIMELSKLVGDNASSQIMSRLFKAAGDYFMARYATRTR